MRIAAIVVCAVGTAAAFYFVGAAAKVYFAGGNISDAISGFSAKSPVPEMCRDQAMDLLQKGATIVAAANQGVDLKSFSANLIAFKASYNLAKGLWPSNVPSTATQTNLDRAVKAWDAALQCLNLREKGGGGRVYEGGAEWGLIASLTDNGKGVKVRAEEEGARKGKRYIWLDEALASRLLLEGNICFEKGKIELFKLLPQAK
jgi:hypothetical protein